MINELLEKKNHHGASLLMNHKVKGKSFRHLYYSNCVMPLYSFLSNKLGIILPESNYNHIARLTTLSFIPINFRIFVYKYTNNVLMFAEREANAFPDKQIDKACKGCLVNNIHPAVSEKSEHILYFCEGTKILRDRLGEITLNRNFDIEELSIGYTESTIARNLAINCLILLHHKFIYDYRKVPANLNNLIFFKEWLISSIHSMLINNILLRDTCLCIVEEI